MRNRTSYQAERVRATVDMLLDATEKLLDVKKPLVVRSKCLKEIKLLCSDVFRESQQYFNVEHSETTLKTLAWNSEVYNEEN